jgi:hypothetical protein
MGNSTSQDAPGALRPRVSLSVRVTTTVSGRIRGRSCVPGRHAFYYYRPQDLADVLRPIVRRFVEN